MESFLIATGMTSFALGAAMTLFALTVVRDNRRREAARVQLLSGLAFPDGVPVASGPAFDEFEHVRSGSDEFPSEQATPPETLFREPEKSGAASRRMIALAAVAAVLMVGVGTFKLFSTTHATPAPAAAQAPGAPAAATTPVTTTPVTPPDARLELLALDHSTTPAGLVVTGRLRNPATGASLHDVVAVVSVLDRTGRVLTTARAPIGRAVLNAGEWSDFSVATKRTAEVARYRIEFHARERASVPQIDLRHAGPTSRSE